MRKKVIISLICLATVAVLAGVVCLSVFLATRVTMDDVVDVPVYQLDKKYLSIVDKDNTYLGHPDLVRTDSGRLIVVYPSGHGKGAIITKTSDDNGKTWSERLTDTPDSWTTSQETPIVYNLHLSDGSNKIVLTSGCPIWGDGTEYFANGFNCSISYDDGNSWTQFTNWYGKDWAQANGKEPYDAIVAMASLTQVKENGVLVDKWLGLFHDHSFVNYGTYLTFDSEGNAIWSEPFPILQQHRQAEIEYNLCEIEVLRNGDCLIMLARANSKKSNSMILFSYDEGVTWSEPKELPNELSGDRHKAEFDPTTGKLLVTFRQVIPNVKENAFAESTFFGHSWVAWVGTIDDLMSYSDDDKSNDAKGDAIIVLGNNKVGTGADCGYAGTVCIDGTFVLVSYGYFNATTPYPYIACARFRLSDLGIA